MGGHRLQGPHPDFDNDYESPQSANEYGEPAGGERAPGRTTLAESAYAAARRLMGGGGPAPDGDAARKNILALHLDIELAGVRDLAERYSGRPLNEEQLGVLRGLVAQRVAVLQQLGQVIAQHDAAQDRADSAQAALDAQENLPAWKRALRGNARRFMLTHGWILKAAAGMSDFINRHGERTREIREAAIARGDYRGASFAHAYAYVEMQVDQISTGLGTAAREAKAAREAESALEALEHSLAAVVGVAEAGLAAYALVEPFAGGSPGGPVTPAAVAADGALAVGHVVGHSAIAGVAAPLSWAGIAMATAAVGGEKGSAAAGGGSEKVDGEKDKQVASREPSTRPEPARSEAVPRHASSRSLTDIQTRDWYHARLAEIDEVLARMEAEGRSREEIAKTVHGLRNEAKMQGRELMKNQDLAKSLPPPLSWEEALAKYDGDYEKIIEGSKQSNTSVDTMIEQRRARGEK